MSQTKITEEMKVTAERARRDMILRHIARAEILDGIYKPPVDRHKEQFVPGAFGRNIPRLVSSKLLK